jgi:hypothetical protein
VDHHDKAQKITTSLAAEQLIPCILHMKMQLIEKVFHSLMNTALDRYGESQLDKSIRSLLATQVELCMKCKVMGDLSKGIQSQWKFCWNKEHFKEKSSLTGCTAQKILFNLKSSTDVTFSEEMDQDSLNKEDTRTSNHLKLEKWNTMCDDLVPL